MRAFAAAVVLSALLFACSGDREAKREVPVDEAAELLLNRNWLDRWPQHESEKLHVFRFVPSMGGGVFQDRTLYAGTFELFNFEVHDSKIHFILPHTGDDVTTPFEIERIDGPAPFDLKLTISDSPRGPVVYYGRSAETASDLSFGLLRN